MFKDSIAVEKFKELQLRFGFVRLVETGTMLGDTSLAASSLCKVTTIEINPEFRQKAIEKWKEAGFEQRSIDRFIHADGREIVSILGDSSVELVKWLKENGEEPTCFYLDAHWHNMESLSEEITRQEMAKAKWPLLSELSAIASAKVKPRCVIIHDFRVPGKNWAFLNYNGQVLDRSYVESGLRAINPEFAIFYNTSASPSYGHEGIGILYAVPSLGVRESIDAAIARAPVRPAGDTPCTIPLMSKYFQDVKVIFEIGASIGNDLPTIHQLWPNAAIHCFEPDPLSYDRLKEFESAHIICNPIALNNSSGEVTYHQFIPIGQTAKERSEWLMMAGSIRPAAGPQAIGVGQNNARDHTFSVSCLTMDEYCSRKGIQPDLLLMDTQGSEYDILEGGLKALPGVKGILLEWSSRELYAGQKLLPDLDALLGKFGFERKDVVYQWLDFHGDAVYVNKHFWPVQSSSPLA